LEDCFQSFAELNAPDHIVVEDTAEADKAEIAGYCMDSEEGIVVEIEGSDIVSEEDTEAAAHTLKWSEWARW